MMRSRCSRNRGGRYRAGLLGLVATLFSLTAFGQGGPPVPGTINRAVRPPAAPNGASRRIVPPSPGGPPAPGVPPVPGGGTAMAAPSRAAAPAPADGELPADVLAGDKLNFNQAPLEIVLTDVADRMGRTLLLSPNLPKATITLQSKDELTLDEYLKAVESVLNMNGIGLIRVDEKFLKVVSNKEIMRDELAILEQKFSTVPGATTGAVERVVAPLNETGQIVSQLIRLKYIEVEEAKTAIEPILHPYANVILYKDIRCLLISDTAANINRATQILRMIDFPVEAREELLTIKIRYAKASDIQAVIEKIITASKEQQGQQAATAPRSKNTGAPGVVRAPTPTLPGVIRAVTPPPATDTGGGDAVAGGEQAPRGLFVGEVNIVADDRTKLLIIVTRPENEERLVQIVDALDVETTPDFEVVVRRLEYAEAKTVEGMLNELIGGKSSSKDEKAPVGKPEAEGEGRSARLKEYVEQRQHTSTQAKETGGAGGEAAKSKVGQLSAENITILSDERSNSLIIQASRADQATLAGIIDDMDKMLSQVLIEAVILEVQLSDSVQSGVDWVQRSMIAYNEKAGGGRSPIFSFAGGGGGGGNIPVDATTLGRPSVGSGLSYYFTLFNMNMDIAAAIRAGDSRAHILSSPVIVTHDNTEATIESSEERYFYKGQRYVGSGVDYGTGRYEPDVERRKVGIKLKVTPHINEKKLVVMEIDQSVEQLTEGQTIGDTTWPTVLVREMSANIAVQNRETIVLGGLVKTQKNNSDTGIPLLRKIPLLGLLFKQLKKEDTQSEIVVFITPYVLDSSEEMVAESRRRKHSLSAEGMWERGWSDSKLAEPEAPDESLIGDDAQGMRVETEPATMTEE